MTRHPKVQAWIDGLTTQARVHLNGAAISKHDWAALGASMDEAPVVVSEPAAPSERATWMRAERKRRGWSQQELADRMGLVAPAMLSQLERGRRPITDGMHRRLQAAFGGADQ